MPSEIKSVWAPPGTWGVWVKLPAALAGQFRVRIDAESESSAPSSFELEVEYFDEAGRHQFERGFGPFNFLTERDAMQEISFRAKSHGLGQNLRVSWSMAGVRNRN
jgi:hypothetical protein